MRFYLSLCLVLLIQLESEAQQEKKHQQNKIDSLKHGWESSTGKERLEFISELNKIYRDSSYDVALGYANDYYKLALALGDSVCIVKGGRMVAYTLMDLSKNEEAANLLVKALGTAKRNGEKIPELKKQIKFILNNAGIALTMLGKYDDALDYHYQSLIIREQEGDKRSIRVALNNIGFVFYNLSDYEHAIQNYLKAVEISNELNEFKGQEMYLINIGLSYNALGKSQVAIKFIQKAFKVCEGNCEDNILKGGYHGLGLAYYDQGKLVEAKMNFFKSIKIARKQNDNRFICENLLALGTIESDVHHEDESINYFKNALILAKTFRMTENQISLYKEFSRIYKKRNDFKNAFFCQERCGQLKDSIYNNTSMKKLTKTQTDFAERENVKAIKAKDQVLLLKEELISKQKLQTILMGAVATLLLLLAGILYKFYRDKLRINIKLDQKVKERTEELRQNNSSLIYANEMQHSLLQKIGRDGQSIVSGIKGLCHMARIDSVEKAQEYFQKLDESTNKLAYLFSRVENG